ncbi:maleylpyruvate isomerase N-terminal domain-containing protein [Cellulosimicrobium cellulans]|uniref:maleylpyruvate isomerase N-terminal domain-containing protein n=1 Tax=Cellulosimicrobium cellulans TaxID=1710 RepID=UPI002096F3A1|nr:maleylpyruvate isomerase N-terminal domain-containing protein [Cellulosimicrobium cellulans]MCO7275148.1 maleylpyruvate isomerase N-terminal domain-containing protein [Cellulosimicrobium cellulans]
MLPFTRAVTALQDAVDALGDEHWERPSGCTGWLVRDLVCHLTIGAQDVLVTLVTPQDAAPTVDAVSYWRVGDGEEHPDPHGRLVARLAAAYGRPGALRHHVDDLLAAAGRAAELADPGARVGTQGETLTVRDFLDAYVLEWTVHHLDLVAHLPAAADPPAETLAASSALLEALLGAPVPPSLADPDALRVVTGRRAPTAAEREDLGPLAARLPVSLG